MSETGAFPEVPTTGAPTTDAPAAPDTAAAAVAYTVRRAAAFIDVHRDTLYRMIRRGEIPHVRVSAGIRVRRVDLEAYLAGRTTTTWTRRAGNAAA